MSILPLKQGYNRFFGVKKSDMEKKAYVQVVSRVGKMPLVMFVSAPDYVGILPTISVFFIT